jgi:hypothetical protein
MYEWQDLPWKKIERNVFKLQKRIYQASQRGTDDSSQSGEEPDEVSISSPVLNQRWGL